MASVLSHVGERSSGHVLLLATSQSGILHATLPSAYAGLVEAFFCHTP